MKRLIYLIPLLMCLPANGQSLWRNFFTTNRVPVVDVLAGSNAVVVPTLTGTDQRHFTVHSKTDTNVVNALIGSAGAGQTNNTIVIAGTNATVVTNASGGITTYTVSSTATGTGTAQTNISWTAVTNLQSAQVPYTVITNAPWQYGDSDLTNWAGLNTNVLSSLAQTNISFTAVTNAPWLTATNLLNGTNVAGTITNNTTGQSAYSPTSGTATNNLLKAGDTASGAILTTSSTTNSPSATEFVTGGWVRSLFDGFGVSYYATTNINNTFTNKDVSSAFTTIYELSTNIPAHDQRTYIGQTNNGYFGYVVTTNTFLAVNSGITINAYLSSENGTGTGGPLVKPEIYYSYDKTNWYGDWDSQPQYVPKSVTNLISWVIANPTYTSTNATGFYIQRRYKMVTQTFPIASDVTFHLGTNTASHIALSGANNTSGNAYLAANQTFTGSNHFTVPLVSSLATNAAAANQVLEATSATTAKWGAKTVKSVGISVDGGGSAITSGTKGFISVPYAGTIQSCTLMASPSGSITFYLWRTNSADGSFPPTAVGAIGTNSLSSDVYNVDSTLTGWTTSLAAGDVLAFNIPSAATSITNCTLQLKIQP